MQANPIEALTRAFLISEGYEADLELEARSGVAEKWRKVAEVAIETLKGIGWAEVEPYLERMDGQAKNLRQIEKMMREAGDMQLVHMDEEGVTVTAVTVADWIGLAAFVLSRSEVDA